VLHAVLRRGGIHGHAAHDIARWCVSRDDGRSGTMAVAMLGYGHVAPSPIRPNA
jgi:hypothetical protein